MAAPLDRLSTDTILGNILYPDSLNRIYNEDWEDGPIAHDDSSAGLQYQAWKLTFAGGIFTITPQDVGLPHDITMAPGQDSIMCSLAFDQNARATVVWVTSLGQAKLYWYDTLFGDFKIDDLEAEVTGIMLTLDDKRITQAESNDTLLWYTLANGDQYDLYQKRQRDRYGSALIQKTNVLPYIIKVGMGDNMRVHVTCSNVPP